MLQNKITTGFVIQTYDTDKKEWISQEFIAGDQVDYEDEEGIPLDNTDSVICSQYLSFDMVQPKGKK